MESSWTRQDARGGPDVTEFGTNGIKAERNRGLRNPRLEETIWYQTLFTKIDFGKLRGHSFYFFEKLKIFGTFYT